VVEKVGRTQAGRFKAVLFFQRKAGYAGSSQDPGGGSRVSRNSLAESSIKTSWACASSSRVGSEVGAVRSSLAAPAHR
jgi:hypothetical protein